MNTFSHNIGKCLILFSLFASVSVSDTFAQSNAPDGSPQLPLVKVMEVPGKKPSVLYRYEEKFDMDSDKLVPTAGLQEFRQVVDSIMEIDTVTEVNVKGYASIDGPVDLNMQLAKARAKAMAHWLTQETNVKPEIISISSDGNDWKMFENLVKADPKMPCKEELLKIINSSLSSMERQDEMKALEDGGVWRYLALNTFPDMRIAQVNLGGFHKFTVKFDETPQPQPEEEVEVIEVAEATEVPLSDFWTRKIYVKTNAPAWLMLWVNAAFEIDLAPHWSAAVPIYYSGWNYFTSKLKFRTFSVVPEVRWWPREDNMGFFLNAHLGLNQFNYAKGGEWRYQTWHGHSPALGGGVGLGYRWYFCKNHRWSMEAEVGAGVYHLDYSIFENVHNGLIVGRRIRTFFGIDQASLSFNYSFGVQRKEVKK